MLFAISQANASSFRPFFVSGAPSEIHQIWHIKLHAEKLEYKGNVKATLIGDKDKYQSIIGKSEWTTPGDTVCIISGYISQEKSSEKISLTRYLQNNKVQLLYGDFDSPNHAHGDWMTDGVTGKWEAEIETK